MLYDNLIIGSGPTAATLCDQLLKYNKKVTVIDVGNVIEDENHNIKKQYHNDKNREKFLNLIKQKKILNHYKNPHLKFPFGSEFVFKKNDFENFSAPINLDFIFSNAYGGLSNVWGTMYAPFFQKDIDNWNIEFKDYYQNVKEIEELVPTSSTDDNLNKFFGFNFGSEHKYKLSNTAKNLLENLTNKQADLNKNGFYFGRSKVAVGSLYSLNNVECQECGLCHYGCPYDCMFNSTQILERLKKNNNYQYINNKFAKKIIVNGDHNILECIDTKTKITQKYYFKNIFLCCGPISTAALLLRSNYVRSNKVVFKESQRFYLPVFNKKNIKDSINQNKNSLCEIYFDIFNENLLSKSIHLQYYSYLDIFLKPLEKVFGKYVHLLPKFFPFVFGRINLLIGYLHSDFSSKIIMKMDKNLNNETSYEYSLNYEKAEGIEEIIKKITHYLKKNLANEFYISNKLTNINIPGASYHYGSSFPMSKENKTFKDFTDLNGKLNDFDNVFILDASILPDMPSQPTTLNVCINVKRIVKNLKSLGKI